MIDKLLARHHRNMGTADRAIRIAVGVAMLIAYAMLPEAGMRGLLLLGIVPLATGIVGFCGLYRLVGVNTCGIRKP